ncbi:MAG: 1-deoxy-D-xylulose-5-phosphate synthase [Nitrospirae bacterium]|nr:1-deoxy-D-xylulose-5-phosphate synthase [Nitrospirota bacterium]MBI5696314.1 1-deoxy-D-xylulose-5-phosphate synthase [Nitrospirota bacterium]
MALLDRIKSPADLKGLSVEQLAELAADIREDIIAVVSANGGHLASSLGVVELTLALHHVYDTPKDKLVWDVGHQAYAHKLLTGRRDRFRTLRQQDGLSGFPKRSESEYDTFDVGHSSTSISAAVGMAVARDVKGEDYRVAAIIGDGSMTAGLAFEGLNQAGHLKKDLVVILNDNEMSISTNVGALSGYLSRIITGERAEKFKRDTESFLKRIPRFGERALKVASKAEESIKGLFAPGMLFEEMGFNYVGPVDGHDLEMLVDTLTDVRSRKGPVLVHVLTKKGMGYEPAEDNPTAFHGTPPFDVESGSTAKSSGVTYTGVFGDALVELAKADESIIAISAAMPEGTGLSKFASEIPGRFFDVGIAEQHGVTFAAGLAASGLKPVTAIYSTFLQRSYDQVVHDVCMQKLPVVFAMDRAGVVGEDGETHQGLFDVSYLRHIPNLVFMAPKDENELRNMLYTGFKLGCPVALRYPRGKGEGVALDPEFSEVPVGRAELLADGSDLVIIALGNTVSPSLKAAETLAAKGYSVGVVNARFVKPLDTELILSLARNVKRIMTVEENMLAGGFGSAVLEALDDAGMRHVPVRRLGVPDEYVLQGTQAQIRKRLGLDAEGIAASALEFMDKGAASAQASNIRSLAG